MLQQLTLCFWAVLQKSPIIYAFKKMPIILKINPLFLANTFL